MTKPNISLPVLTEKQIACFWSKAEINPATGCLEWMGGRRGGYGRVKFKKRTIPTHRLAYFLYHGVNPGKLCVLHTCDNPPCLSKAHLFLGTNQDNMDDMIKKGRSLKGDRNPTRTNPEILARGSRNGMHTKPEKRSKGESNGNSKLTDEQVREIRNSYIPNVVSANFLARKYQVAKPQILNIIHRRTWKHVDETKQN